MAEESSTGQSERLSRHLSEHHCVHGAVSAEVTHSHLGIIANEEERRGWRRCLGRTKQEMLAAEVSVPMSIRSIFAFSTRDQQISFSDENFCKLTKGLCPSCQSNAPIISGSWDVKDRKVYFEAPTATITCSQGHSQVATGPFEADNPSAPTSFADTIASKEWPCATCGVNRSMTIDHAPEETKACYDSCDDIDLRGIRQRTLGSTRIDQLFSE